MEYGIDDRGNEVDFHRGNGDGTWTRYAAILDREDGPMANELAWDGDVDATGFACKNGYSDEIAQARRRSVFERGCYPAPRLWTPPNR